MAFTLDPTTPADADSPRQGASKIRALTLQLLQLLTQGGGSAVTFAAAPLSVDTAGNVTIPTTLTVPTPTAIGHAVTKSYADQLGPWSGVAAGTNTYTVTLADPNGVAPNSLAQLVGLPLSIQFTNGNTGAATLNPNGFGAKAIQTNGAALTSGQLQAGLYATVIYDGTQFELIADGITVANSGITLATKGSYTFQGGLILKWNSIAFAGVTSVSDTFATAFPTAAFVALISPAANLAPTNGPFVSALNTTTISISMSGNTTYTGNVYYLALGN